MQGNLELFQPRRMVKATKTLSQWALKCHHWLAKPEATGTISALPSIIYSCEEGMKKLLYCILGIEFLSAAAEQAVWVVDQFSLAVSTIYFLFQAASQKCWSKVNGPKMTEN